jgi:uncharacterized membrane protein YhaH (DUF805 family)
VFDGITSSQTYYTQPGILEIPGAAPLILTGLVLLGLIWLATIVPNLALAWRRLHDANFPGPFSVSQDVRERLSLPPRRRAPT